MKNAISEIDKLTCREKELFIHYVMEGFSEDARNNYMAYTENSRTLMNHLTHSLKKKGFLISTEKGVLKINNI